VFSDAEYDASDNMSDIDSLERLNGGGGVAALHCKTNGNGGGSISSSHSGFQFPDFNNIVIPGGISSSQSDESRFFPSSSSSHHQHHRRHFHHSTDDSRTLGSSFADSDSLDYYPHHQRPVVEIADSDPFDPRVLRIGALKQSRVLDAERFLREMRSSIEGAVQSFGTDVAAVDEQLRSAGATQGGWEGTWSTTTTTTTAATTPMTGTMNRNGNGYLTANGSFGSGGGGGGGTERSRLVEREARDEGIAL